MQFINRLKTYGFSLEEIKILLESSNESLYIELFRKKQELKIVGKLEQKIEQVCENLNLLQ